MKKNKIAVILYGNIKYDGRVQKIIKTIKKYKKEVVLFVSEFDSNDNLKNYDFCIKVIENKYKKAGTFFTLLNLLYFNFKVNKIIKKEEYEFIHCNDLNTMFFSKYLSKKSKVIFDAHELFPEAQNSKIKTLIWNIIEKKNIRYAYKIIQVEKNRREYFIKKHELDKNSVELIENFPSVLKFNLNRDFFLKKYNYMNSKKISLYIGAVTRERGILEILKIIKIKEELVFFCIGKCNDLEYMKVLKEFSKENKIEDRVFFKDNIAQEEVLYATNSSDIVFIFYQNTNLNNYFCASNKLYEALNCGVKILTNDYIGILSITKNIPNVFNVRTLDIQELEKGMNYLLKINERKRSNFYWENQENKIMSVYSGGDKF